MFNGQIQRKPYRRFDLDLGIARTAEQFNEVGSFIWVEECNGDVYIKLDDNQAAFFKLTEGGYYKTSNYKQFWIKNTAQAGKSLKALIGDANFFRCFLRGVSDHAKLKNVLTSQHHTKTADNEVYGLIKTGILANRPTDGIADRWYFGTDTKVIYYTFGTPNIWLEVCRGEAAIRLAELLEKNHASLTNVLPDQHADTKVRTKEVDESAIGNDKILQYDSASGKLKYVAPVGGMGAPDYDSGWVAIGPDEEKRFTHNFATYDYFFYYEGRWFLDPESFSINQLGYGAQLGWLANGLHLSHKGVNDVWVWREPDDTFWEEVRIRCWRI